MDQPATVATRTGGNLAGVGQDRPAHANAKRTEVFVGTEPANHSKAHALTKGTRTNGAILAQAAPRAPARFAYNLLGGGFAPRDRFIQVNAATGQHPAAEFAGKAIGDNSLRPILADALHPIPLQRCAHHHQKQNLHNLAF